MSHSRNDGSSSTSTSGQGEAPSTAGPSEVKVERSRSLLRVEAGDGLTVAVSEAEDYEAKPAFSAAQDRFKRLHEHLSPEPGGGRTRRLEDHDLRLLDRLAWVLTCLNYGRRGCVAVVRTRKGKFHLFANKPDAELNTDFKALSEIAGCPKGGTAEQEKAGALMPRMRKEMGHLYLEEDQFDRDQVVRRIKDTADFLRSEGTALESEAHTGHHGTGIHAESGAADLVYRRAAQKPEYDAPVGLDIGISKLCCFSCFLMVGAVTKVTGLPLRVSGSHFHTYRGWKAPSVLLQEKVLKAFLDLDGSILPPDENDTGLLSALGAESVRRAAIAGIELTKELKGPSPLTRYLSSEEEKDAVRRAASTQTQPRKLKQVAKPPKDSDSEYSADEEAPRVESTVQTRAGKRKQAPSTTPGELLSKKQKVDSDPYEGDSEGDTDSEDR